MDKLVEGVKELNLRFVIYSLNDLKQVCEFIKKTNTLQTLYLGYNRIGNTGCKYLADALKYNHSLQILNLAGNQIGDEGCKYLANALNNNHSLQELYLSYNQIGNEGCRYLADALKNNHSLQRLDLADNQIGDEGHNYFWNKFNYSNNRIETLWLDCKISQLSFFHKYLHGYNGIYKTKQRKWFIQNFKHRSNKLWLFLFLKN